jgi:hypothetical protein
LAPTDITEEPAPWAPDITVEPTADGGTELRRPGGEAITDGRAASVAPAPRAKKTTASARGVSDSERIEAALKEVPGIGPAKRQAIIERYPTMRRLKAATPEKLTEIPGISRTLAERIHTAVRSA